MPNPAATSSPQPTAAPIPVAILGPTGYTGLELIEILSRHPAIRVSYLASARTPAPRIDAEFPRLTSRVAAGVAECHAIDHDAIAAACRLAFLCLPHEAAMEHAPALLARGVKVVDLSAAYRIKDSTVYERAYGHRHTDPAGLEHAVYGLTEFARGAVRRAMLVANPGCYPTAAAIALIPLLQAGLIKPDSIVINAASGVTGAGRAPRANLHYPEVTENYSAYGIGAHRHQPEIAQSLAVWGGTTVPGREPLFMPHLLPVARGILETICAEPASTSVDTAAVQSALRSAYADEAFVVVREEAPTLQDVHRTNMVHVNGRVASGRVVVVAAEDNLVKGASGQAVQNANLMLGLEETTGLM
ncbi:MAG: N-acetyl-gamma-glutamyl-phosphate reductase [Phycisphaeraceae bacterium]|nr:N-acetyl-gamma-glutamyl-phosphate reductase [Phycisphaeraceae bacterium]